MKRTAPAVMVMILTAILPPAKATEKNLDWSLPLMTLDGRKESLKSYRGKVLVLNFWATWCGPCREEMPDFEKFHRAYRKRGVALLGISVDTSSSDVQKFLKDVQVTYPIYRDGPSGPWAKKFSGFPFLPMTVIYDRNGKYVKTLIGPHEFKDLEAIVRPLLETDSQALRRDRRAGTE